MPAFCQVFSLKNRPKIQSVLYTRQYGTFQAFQAFIQNLVELTKLGKIVH
jgi:hypothetical protein